MNEALDELYQQVILDHSKRPRNYGEIAEGAVKVEGYNPSCGDEIQLWLKRDAHGAVGEVKFTGQGCAISRASASLMTAKVKGKSEADARALIQSFHDIVSGAKEGDPIALGDLTLFQGVRRFPQRVKCAMLAWRALEQALAGHSGETTTEV